MRVKIINRTKFELPIFSAQNHSGMILRADLEHKVINNAMERALIDSGLFIELKLGYEALIRAERR